MISKMTTIVLIVTLLIIAVVVIACFEFAPRNSTLAIIYTLNSYRKVHGYLPNDLSELSFWEKRLVPCDNKPEKSWSKYIISYNPEYDKNNKEWVVTVIGRKNRSFRYVTYALWADGKITEEDTPEDISENSKNIKYYYLTR